MEYTWDCQQKANWVIHMPIRRVMWLKSDPSYVKFVIDYKSDELPIIKIVEFVAIFLEKGEECLLDVHVIWLLVEFEFPYPCQ